MFKFYFKSSRMREGIMHGLVDEVKPKRRDFTLIELLVVLVVIAILISLLMPSLSKAKEKGKRVVCASNLKGIGTGVVLFANDNKFKYPDPLSTGASMWTMAGPMKTTLGGERPLNKYLGIQDNGNTWASDVKTKLTILACPSELSDSPIDNGKKYLFYYKLGTSYCFNMRDRMSHEGAGSWNSPRWNFMHEWVDPSGLVLAGDLTLNGRMSGYYYGSLLSQYFNGPHGNHLTNMLFGDNSVRLTQMTSDLKSGTDNLVGEDWSFDIEDRL